MICPVLQLAEYAYGERLTDKVDVYSYGVVVLEMITKLRPTSNIFTNGKSLPKWVQSAVNGNWMDVIDLDLKKEIQDGLAAQECIYSVLALALACTKEAPKDRSTMLDVLDALVLLKQGKVIQVEVEPSPGPAIVDTSSHSTAEPASLGSGTSSP